MATSSLQKLFTRDINKLIEEVTSLKNDHLWTVKPGITNSIGNLCLHICGNLNHFIGTVLGETGYVRQREYEFAAKGVPVKEITEQLKNTNAVVISTLQQLSDSALEKIYPVSLWNETFSTEFFLLHLHAHLNYHLGQVNYLRRILDSDN